MNNCSKGNEFESNNNDREDREMIHILNTLRDRYSFKYYDLRNYIINEFRDYKK